MRWMTVLHMSTRVKRTGFQKPVFHFKRTWIVLCHLMRVGHVSFSPQNRHHVGRRQLNTYQS